MRRGRDLAHGGVRPAGEGIAASPLRPQAAAHVEVEAVRAAVVEGDRHADPVQTSPTDVADPELVAGVIDQQLLPVEGGMDEPVFDDTNGLEAPGAGSQL